MQREHIVGAVLLALVIGGLFVIGASSQESGSSQTLSRPSLAKPYIELVNPSGFVNTGDKPIRLADYVGEKVILLDIMTYSCINCQRTFPYVTAWYEKYKDDGLIVIGLHTPEFAFEKDKKNVEAAMREFGITFPVVLDNDYATWNALGNRYWPRKYLIDIHGNIVYDHIGEGAYEETERKIQQLLAERAQVLGEAVPDDDALATVSIDAKTTTAQSPETYFGALRNEYLANGSPRRAGEQTYVLSSTILLNKLYLGGRWRITDEYTESTAGASVAYRYRAKEVYLVMSADIPTPVEVWQDGKKIKTITVQESKLYTLISNESPGEHQLELRFAQPGVRLYAFTFG